MYLDGRLDAAVESDVVGYTTTTVQGKVNGRTTWYQISIQFKGLNETEDKIKLGEAINATGLIPTTWSAKDSGASIQFHNPETSAYDTYYYVSDAYYFDEDGSLKTTTGWAKGMMLAEDDYIAVGRAFWFKANNLAEGQTATITIAGTASILEPTKTISLEKNIWQLIGNPFPNAIKISDIQVTCTPETWQTKDKGVSIQVHNASTGAYNTYYYVSDAYYFDNGTLKTTTGWAKGMMLAEDIIPVAAGFWLKGSTTEDVTVTFSL